MTQTLKEKIARIVTLDHIQLLTDYDVDADLYRTDPESPGSVNATADAILSVIAESVEPLVWEAEDGRETCLDAEGCDKLYRVLVRHDGTAVLRHNASSFQQEDHVSEKAAKAAAQADYTRRILSVLGLSTPEQEAGND